MEYNRRVMLKNGSAREYRLYMLRYKVRSAAKYMFPSRRTLKQLYPRAGRHAALTPFLFVYLRIYLLGIPAAAMYNYESRCKRPGRRNDARRMRGSPHFPLTICRRVFILKHALQNNWLLRS